MKMSRIKESEGKRDFVYVHGFSLDSIFNTVCDYRLQFGSDLKRLQWDVERMRNLIGRFCEGFIR